jgi:hypothetical protein
MRMRVNRSGKHKLSAAINDLRTRAGLQVRSDFYNLFAAHGHIRFVCAAGRYDLAVFE